MSSEIVKTCSLCKTTKTIDNFSKNGYTKAGTPSYRSRCKECEGNKTRISKPIDIKVGRNIHRKCSKCGEFKPLDKNHFPPSKTPKTFRNKCKSCRSIEQKERVLKKKNEDIVKFKCTEMARSAYSRTHDPSKSYKKCYRNLDTPYGFESTQEMSDYLYHNFYEDIKRLLNEGISPSVDRIDSRRGYTPDNIRILSHRENTLLGVEKRRKNQ